MILSLTIFFSLFFFFLPTFVFQFLWKCFNLSTTSDLLSLSLFLPSRSLFSSFLNTTPLPRPLLLPPCYYFHPSCAIFEPHPRRADDREGKSSWDDRRDGTYHSRVELRGVMIPSSSVDIRLVNSMFRLFLSPCWFRFRSPTWFGGSPLTSWMWRENASLLNDPMNIVYFLLCVALITFPPPPKKRKTTRADSKLDKSDSQIERSVLLLVTENLMSICWNQNGTRNIWKKKKNGIFFAIDTLVILMNIFLTHCVA